MGVFSSVYRTFTKLDNTSHKENLNKEKNLKFLFQLKRRHFWPGEHREARAKEKKEGTRVNIVHWVFGGQGEQGQKRVNGN